MKRTGGAWLIAAGMAAGACYDAGGASSGSGGGHPWTDGGSDAPCSSPSEAGTATMGDAAPDVATTCGWQPYSDGLVGGYVTDVAYDPRTPGVAWATSADHLYKSTDHGATWALVSVAPLTFNQLALPSDSPDHILAAANGGMLASADGGATWTRALDGLTTLSILAHPADALRVYVGTYGAGILRSDDGGTSFAPVNYEVPYAAYVALDGDPTNVDVVLAAEADIDSTDNYSNAGSILRTTDGGGSWAGAASTFGISWRLARCETMPSIVYAAAREGLARSVDGGVTWNAAVSVFNDADVAIAPSDCNTVYNTEFGTGVFRSTDGSATFAGPFTNGIPFANAFPRRVSVDPSDSTRLLGTTPGGLLYSTDGGADWSLVGGLMGFDVRSIATSPTKPDRLWMSTWGAQGFVRDGAAPWTRVPLAVDYQFVVAPDPTVANRTFFGTWSVDESTVDGTTFVTGGLTTNPLAFAFDPTAPQTVYAATELGGVYKSSNGGRTWVSASSDIPPWQDGNGNVVDVRAIMVDATSSQRVLLAAYENGLWVSNDGAGTWAKNATFATLSWGDFAELTAGTPALFAVVGGHGVQRSDDGGTTWHSVSSGIPTEDIMGLVADPVGGGLYASTSFGVYRSIDRGATWVGLETDCSPMNGMTYEAIVTTPTGPQLAAVAAGGFGVFVHPL